MELSLCKANHYLSKWAGFISTHNRQTRILNIARYVIKLLWLCYVLMTFRNGFFCVFYATGLPISRINYSYLSGQSHLCYLEFVWFNWIIKIKCLVTIDVVKHISNITILSKQYGYFILICSCSNKRDLLQKLKKFCNKCTNVYLYFHIIWITV